MKRFLVLLILLAGGLAAAAFVVPTNAATVDGVSISQQQFNSDLHAIAKSSEYQCFLTAEEAVGTNGEASLPSVSGTASIGEAGSQPTVTAAFAANYLNTVIAHQVAFALAAARQVQITSADLATARQELMQQTTSILSEVASNQQYACDSGGQAVTAKQVLGTMPPSFVDANVKFDATVSVLEEDFAGVGSSEADLRRYYSSHASDFDKACFTVAGYSSEADAQAGAAEVAYGTSFSTVAAAAAAAEGQSPQQQCFILSEVAASLPTGNIESLALNTVSSPIVDGSSYLLLEITSKTPTSYATAHDAVLGAVQSAGATKTGKAITAAEKAANVALDRRYGQWEPSRAEVLPPVSPAAVDVLNPTVNGTEAAPTSASTATGQSS